VELATDFDKAVVTTVDLIKKNDFLGAKTTFRKIEEACVTYHAKFRD
jgi:hypothetical protein